MLLLSSPSISDQGICSGFGTQLLIRPLVFSRVFPFANTLSYFAGIRCFSTALHFKNKSIRTRCRRLPAARGNYKISMICTALAYSKGLFSFDADIRRINAPIKYMLRSHSKYFLLMRTKRDIFFGGAQSLRTRYPEYSVLIPYRTDRLVFCFKLLARITAGEGTVRNRPFRAPSGMWNIYGVNGRQSVCSLTIILCNSRTHFPSNRNAR